jgi:hypothetical protein
LFHLGAKLVDVVEACDTSFIVKPQAFREA